MKIALAALAMLVLFVAATALAMTAPCAPAGVSVKVPDAPCSSPVVTAPVGPRVMTAQHKGAKERAKSAPVRKPVRVYRCERRALQMGTVGDYVQDCYWHDR